MRCPLSTKRVKPFRHVMVDDASKDPSFSAEKKGKKKRIKESGEDFPD